MLTSYSSAVERLGRFQSCSEFASKVKPAIQKLHKDMGTCVRLRGEMNHKTVRLPVQFNPFQQDVFFLSFIGLRSLYKSYLRLEIVGLDKNGFSHVIFF